MALPPPPLRVPCSTRTPYPPQDNVSIMEALTSLAVALGPAFEPYAPAVFERAMALLSAQHAALEAKVRQTRASPLPASLPPRLITQCLSLNF